MKIHSLLMAGFLSVVAFLGLARAEPESLKDFPPLVLVGQDKRATSAFNNSATTTELYRKYSNFARSAKTDNLERLIKAQLDKDIAHWKAEASRKFYFKKKPKSTDKKVLDEYDAARAKAEAIHDRKIAVAETYLNWLEVEIPAWMKKANQSSATVE